MCTVKPRYSKNLSKLNFRVRKFFVVLNSFIYRKNMLYSFKSSYEITFELQRYEITYKTETIRVKQNSL